MAAAHVLHYGVGVPVRKVPAVLRALTGVELSQGAISQDALRRARGAVGDAYHKLRGSVRASQLVHTDDTGWRVDGGPAFLMAFETDEATVYQVRTRHRNEEVREVVPSDYGGVMVTDRGRSYDAQALSGVKQQKCLAHVLRSISEVLQTKRGRGRSFGNRLSRLLREAMELRQAYHRGEAGLGVGRNTHSQPVPSMTTSTTDPYSPESAAVAAQEPDFRAPKNLVRDAFSAFTSVIKDPG